MGFILGVLILGALLAAIFGRRVGAMFVLGTATVALIPLGILVFGLLAIVIGMMMTPDHPQQSANHFQSYGSASDHVSPASSDAPAVSSTRNYAPAVEPYSAPSQPNAAPPSDRQTEVHCPRLGLYFEAGSQNWSALKIMPGAGIQVARVEPGSPGDIGRIQPGDVLVNLNGKYFHMLHSPAELNELLDESGSGVPVHVFYERPGGGKGSGGEKTLLPQ